MELLTHACMTSPLTRLIMRILRVPEEVALLVLGYIAVRRTLSVQIPTPRPVFEAWPPRGGERGGWGYLQ